MRVVLDANVLVSAAISRGPSHRMVQTWLQHRPFELVIVIGCLVRCAAC